MAKKSDVSILKIFLEEKEILLCEKQALESVSAGWTIEYDPGMSLKELFHEFSQDPGAGSMAIWTKRKSFASLKHLFFGLFRIIEAGGGIVANEKGGILFMMRRGKWDLPKGKIDKGNRGESAREGAIREVKEETGLKKVTVLSEAEPTYHIYYIKGKPVLKHTRWFRMKSRSDEKLVPETREDITVVEWLGRREMKKVLDNTFASLKPMIRNLAGEQTHTSGKYS